MIKSSDIENVNKASTLPEPSPPKINTEPEAATMTEDSLVESRVLRVLNVCESWFRNPVVLGAVGLFGYHLLPLWTVGCLLGTCLLTSFVRTFIKEYLTQQHKAMGPTQITDFAQVQLGASWARLEPHLKSSYYCTTVDDRKQAFVAALEYAVQQFSDHFSMTLTDLIALMPEFGSRGQVHFTESSDSFEALVHRTASMTADESKAQAWERFYRYYKCCCRIKILYRGHPIRASMLKMSRNMNDEDNMCVVEAFGVARRMFPALALHQYSMYLIAAVHDRTKQETALKKLLGGKNN